MTPNDPFGFHADLDRLTTDLCSAASDDLGEAALRVVRAWGHCRRTATAAIPLLDGRLTPDQLRAARAEFADVLAGWSRSVAGLGDSWYECDSPIDADDLCENWVDRRTEIWAAEVAFAEAGLPVDVTAFDAALREHEGVLATVVGFNWYENHVAPFRAAVADVAELPWWLSDHLARVAAETDRRSAATLPPPDYYATVRRVTHWKASDPEVIGAMGAKVKGATASLQTFLWESPDGVFTARLDVLARTTADHRRTAKYPILFERGGKPATELTGTPFRLGSLSPKTLRPLSPKTVGETATIAELWTDSDGRLFVGDPLVEWPLLPPTE